MITRRFRGFTLTELIVTMVISSIVLLALTCQFVAELTFRKRINDQIAATNDASIAMRHMTRVFRYAQPGSVVVRATQFTVGGVIYETSIRAIIDSDFAGSNLPEFADDTEVLYGRKTGDVFSLYKIVDGTEYIISNNITVFSGAWNLLDKDLFIQITAQQGTSSSSLNTKIDISGG